MPWSEQSLKRLTARACKWTYARDENSKIMSAPEFHLMAATRYLLLDYVLQLEARPAEGAKVTSRIFLAKFIWDRIGCSNENRGQHSSPTASAVLAYLFGRILQNHSHSDLRISRRRPSLLWSNQACVQNQTVRKTRKINPKSAYQQEKRLPASETAATVAMCQTQGDRKGGGTVSEALPLSSVGPRRSSCADA